MPSEGDIMNELPERPDLQYRPEVVQIAAPRRKVWPWVLGTAAVLLLMGGLANVAEQDQATTPSAPIAQPTQPGLTSYEGATVSEGVQIMWAAGGRDIVCPAIDQVGYSSARSQYLAADPQLGSDAWEGAVFDQFVLEAC